MFNFLKPKKYHHLTKILIHQDKLVSNYQRLSEFKPNTQIAPVLKSNAYGHGLALVGKVLDTQSPPFLLVDSLFEAYELYKAGVKSQIMILGYTDPRNYAVKKLPFSYVIWDIETARALDKHQPGCEVHLFVDTGMNREGVRLDELEELLTELKKLKNINLNGLCSHLADGNNYQDNSFTELQVENFKKALEIVEAHGYNPQWKHIAATAGAYKVDDPTFNLIRAGKSLYGYDMLEKNDPKYQDIGLQPVLQMMTTIAQVKYLQPGDKVSYDLTFTAKKPMKIALLPLGYNDGLDRRHSNTGWVKVHDQQCPIIGRVCMNITMIDVSQVDKVNVGDKAEIYSLNTEDKNSLVNQAKAAQTIPHDMLSRIDTTLRRELA